MLQYAMGSNQQHPAPLPESVFEKIKKLKELLDIGAITADEFKDKKSKLMGDI